MRDILSMPFFDGYELIKYAMDAEVEEKLFLRWAIGYQYSLSFEEFKRKAGAVEEIEDNRTAEEILDMVRDIIG